jgi:hypothetical protein
MHTLALAAVLISLIAFPAVGQTPEQPAPAGQPEELPEASSLFEAHIEATGGLEAHLGHRNRVLHGIYKVVSTGEHQILTIHQEAPDKFHLAVEVPGVATTIRVTDGAVVWGEDLSGEAFAVSDAERRELLDNSVFHGEAAYKDRYSSIKTTGVGSVNGRRAWQVEFETRTGIEGAVYFDAETKLVIAREVRSVSNPGQSTVVDVAGYKPVEGVLFPTVQRQRPRGQSRPTVEVEFRWIEVNVDRMPDFTAPPDLEARSGG